MHYPASKPGAITLSSAIKFTLIFVLTLPLCALVVVGLCCRLFRKSS